MRSLTLLPQPPVTEAELRSTAAEAADGGAVVGLVPLDPLGRCWHATVVTAAGVRDVRLDTELRTAEVVMTPAVSDAA
ncbi:hypothetical protein [Paraconexibacter sp.]|uniref:hypothetical protein n=1 Tax=Paraconexibacter sp. TaxID=2949640 RepID=UPI003568C17A